jgi:hypothetical protein
MADVKEDEAAESGSDTRPAPGGTRIVWIVMAVLLVLFVAVGIASKKSTPKPFKTVGARAVVMPTLDRPRTVVVPPCSPPTVIDASNAASQFQVPGAVAVTLPKGPAARVVVVPRCAAVAAPSPGALNVPSSAFVLKAGEAVSETETVPTGGDPIAFGIKHQVTLPTQSPVTTIVVPPCQGTATAVTTTVLKPLGGSGVAVAPNC